MSSHALKISPRPQNSSYFSYMQRKMWAWVGLVLHYQQWLRVVNSQRRLQQHQRQPALFINVSILRFVLKQRFICVPMRMYFVGKWKNICFAQLRLQHHQRQPTLFINICIVSFLIFVISIMIIVSKNDHYQHHRVLRIGTRACRRLFPMVCKVCFLKWMFILQCNMER